MAANDSNTRYSSGVRVQLALGAVSLPACQIDLHLAKRKYRSLSDPRTLPAALPHSCKSSGVLRVWLRIIRASIQRRNLPALHRARRSTM